MRAVRLLIPALAVMLVVTGCARSTSKPSSPKAPPKSAATGAAIETMEPQVKRSEITSDFPFEIPVPTGEILSGSSQLGGSVYDYAVVVSASVPELAEWYRQAYTVREWTVVEDRPIPGESELNGIALGFRKHQAESRVTIVPESKGKAARADVVVGLTAPVLELQ